MINFTLHVTHHTMEMRMQLWSSLVVASLVKSLDRFPVYILHTHSLAFRRPLGSTISTRLRISWRRTDLRCLGFGSLRRAMMHCNPQWMGNYVVTEFNFTTRFGGQMSAKIFSGALDTSHVLVRDCGGEPCILGRLKVQTLSASDHIIQARGDLLRPARPWRV